MRSPLSLLTLLGLCACLSGCASTGPWPVSVSEGLALESLDAKVAKLDASVAAIASGNPALAREVIGIAQEYHGLFVTNERIMKDAATTRGLDVALVLSGATWVKAPR